MPINFDSFGVFIGSPKQFSWWYGCVTAVRLSLTSWKIRRRLDTVCWSLRSTSLKRKPNPAASRPDAHQTSSTTEFPRPSHPSCYLPVEEVESKASQRSSQPNVEVLFFPFLLFGDPGMGSSLKSAMLEETFSFTALYLNGGPDLEGKLAEMRTPTSRVLMNTAGYSFPLTSVNGPPTAVLAG